MKQIYTGEYYHVYNRGVDKRTVFVDRRDYERFLSGMREFNRKEPIKSLYLLNRQRRNDRSGPTAKSELAEIIAYCLNPNHFHLILRQLVDNGIPEFMKRLGGGYTWYFNNKHDRSGVLFQGKYKSVHVDSNEYLLHLSVYVNMNYEIHGYGKMKDWPYTSFQQYVTGKKDSLCPVNHILSQFKNNPQDYRKFAESNCDYFVQKKEIEKYCLEC